MANVIVGAETTESATVIETEESIVEGEAVNANRVPNPLEPCASYNAILGLAVLTKDEVNDPNNTYKSSGLSNIIIRGGGSKGKTVQTIYEKNNEKLEYFMDDLTIESILTHNNRSSITTAFSLNFKVFEPYSAGLFLQTLQIASLENGYKNYIEAPFAITIEFQGWDENNNNQTQLVEYSKVIPIKLVQASFSLNASGSEYDVQAVPWQTQALYDDFQKTLSSSEISGATVVEVLQKGGSGTAERRSLTDMLNERGEYQEQNRQASTAHKYIINFPTEEFRQNTLSNTTDEESSATSSERPDSAVAVTTNRSTTQNTYETLKSRSENDQNINEIGKSLMFSESNLESEDEPNARANRVIESGIINRSHNELQLSGDRRIYKFNQGVRVQDIIEEIILVSDYGRNLVDKLNDASNADENGMVDWFRITTQVFIEQDQTEECLTGNLPKIFVYNVIPYKVHRSRFKIPSTPSSEIENLKKNVSKEYNYIYTGKNLDIIDFEILYNFAFFDAINSDFSRDSGLNSDRARTEQTREGTTPPGCVVSPEGRRGFIAESTTDNAGGSRSRDYKSLVARQYHNALINGNVDLIQAEMKIWGDPYYIPDSGMGNYISGKGRTHTINADNSIDYERTEVDILINFRTPIDYNSKTGLMEFPEDTLSDLQEFTGLYQITTVTSNFSKGQFTQDLTLMRRKSQDAETTAAPNPPLSEQQGEDLANSKNSGVVQASTPYVPIETGAPPPTSQTITTDFTDDAKANRRASASPTSASRSFREHNAPPSVSSTTTPQNETPAPDVSQSTIDSTGMDSIERANYISSTNARDTLGADQIRRQADERIIRESTYQPPPADDFDEDEGTFEYIEALLEVRDKNAN